MWTRPRRTIKDLLTRPRNEDVYLLAALAGFSNALDRASLRNAGDSSDLVTIFALCLVVGIFTGILWLWLYSALLRWTGRWIGGVASAGQIRLAMAWAMVPIIWSLLLWGPQLALFGDELFKSETPRMDAHPWAVMALAVVELSIAAWAVVVGLKSLGEVQGFSAWRALGNAAMAGAVLAIPLILIVLALARSWD